MKGSEAMVASDIALDQGADGGALWAAAGEDVSSGESQVS